MHEKVIHFLSDDGLIASARLCAKNFAVLGLLTHGSMCAWTETLEELQRRGLIDLINGSLADPGNAEIRRNYEVLN